MATTTARKSASKTVNDYAPGAAKQDPSTKAVAVRTSPPLQFPWAVMTLTNGGHYASHDDVAEWQDLAGTPVADPEPEPETQE